MADILRARIFAIACGYEDANDLHKIRKSRSKIPVAEEFRTGESGSQCRKQARHGRFHQAGFGQAEEGVECG